MINWRRPGKAAAVFAVILSTNPAFAANLDVSTDYRVRSLAYTNLNLQDQPNGRQFISQNARVGIFVRNIQLPAPIGEVEEQTMDVGVSLRAVGIAGSSTPAQVPFDAIAAHYPNANFTPFIESAYVRVHQLAGYPIEATAGQQPFTLGSGLLLADDGVGMAGLSAIGSLPFWNLKAQGFAFQPRNSQTDFNNLMLYGASLELPTEGTWQINELVEKNRTPGTAAGLGPAIGEIPITRSTKYFTSARYQLSFGPLVFDGEAAMQRGSAITGGVSPQNPSGGGVTYKGDAEIIKAKWRQVLWKGGQEGIVRLTLARGSGDNPSTPNVDERFFPAYGHRYDGMERSGFGEFFAATPYDAFGGRSSSTITGLPPGVSGIITVGIGVTPPAYHGFTLDLDHFLYQADRNGGGPDRTLGNEWDVKIRYPFRDKLSFQASAALFGIGSAINPGKGNARRFMLEAAGRF